MVHLHGKVLKQSSYIYSVIMLPIQWQFKLLIHHLDSVFECTYITEAGRTFANCTQKEAVCGFKRICL